MNIDQSLKPADLRSSLNTLFELASRKSIGLDKSWDRARGTPVFTVKGKYTTRGWTEWTQGFPVRCMILAFDATDQKELFRLGRERTIESMPPHLTHTGVHDHGFNNLSTYGNLRRLMREER
jgi:hypothetical protein